MQRSPTCRAASLDGTEREQPQSKARNKTKIHPYHGFIITHLKNGYEPAVHITNRQFVSVNAFLGQPRQVEISKQQVLKSFGANVRRLRSAAGLTQAKLAERVDVELRTLQKFEAGQINVPLFTLFRVRRALNCKWDELFGDFK